MDPIRAIAPILALASFALVAARGLLMQSGAANTLKDALIAMFLGLIAGTICAAIVRSVVDEHNKEYARANPVRPIGWVEPDQQITEADVMEQSGLVGAGASSGVGANPSTTSKKM